MPTLTTASRIRGTGTALVAGDFALSAGWGTTASVTTISGTDFRFLIEITSAGINQAANPTVTYTYKDGAWPAAPVCVLVPNGSVNGGGANLADVTNLTSRSTTVTVWTLQQTPSAGDIYKFICITIG